MITAFFKRFAALVLASGLAMLPASVRGQSNDWVFQTFNENICGLNSSSNVTLAYDPSQDNTGNGGGSCHVTTDYSQNGLFQINVNNVTCCFCALGTILQLNNYSAIEFDVEWDNSSPVPLSFFNENFSGDTQGIVIGIGSTFQSVSSICYSNLIIPDAATNGWVHLSAAIDHSMTNATFSGLVFQKSYPAYGNYALASFWIDNLMLVGPTVIAGASRDGNNCTLQFPALPGATYTVLKSTNLAQWTNLATVYAPGDGARNALVSFTDTNATGGQAYYRLVRP